MIDVNDHQQEEVVMYEHTKFKAKLKYEHTKFKAKLNFIREI